MCPPEEQAESVNKGVTFKAHRLSQMIPELEFGEDFNENMTFNKKKRNRSLKEEINVNRFDSSELEHKEQIEEENRGEEMTE